MPGRDIRLQNREKQKSQYLIGLDLGTSAIKGVLMSDAGAVIARERAATEYQEEENGSVQFDADDFYRLAAGVIRRLAAEVPDGSTVAGLSMASASGNTLLLDGSGKPALPAISWMDTRATDEMERVFGRQQGADVLELTGWPLIRMFPMAHLAWLRCHNPVAIDRAGKICMTTDYVNYRLTGRWGIDASTATTFYLQDQVRARWHLPYLKRLGIPAEKLPPIFPSGTVLGPISAKAAAETGLRQGTRVVLGAFDHPCAARGSGVLAEGQMLISCGTSWVGFYPVKDRSLAIRQELMVDPFMRPDGLWGALFSLPAIGKNVDNLISRYISGAPDRYHEFDRLAAMAEPGIRGPVINPMHDDQVIDASQYTKSEIASAIMSGTADLLRDKIERFAKGGISATALTMTGGPSESLIWPRIVSDILGIKISIVNGLCAGAVGAAVLAGIAAGLYRDEHDAFEKAAFAKTLITPGSCRVGGS